jgi:hypothetical protein
MIGSCLDGPLTADQRVALIRLKIERAEKHILDLKSAIDAFMKTGPYEIRTKKDPQSRKLIYYIGKVEPVPAQVAIVVGDALQTLRSALDHLAFQLFLVNGSNGNPADIYFPIAVDDNSKLKGLDKLKAIIQTKIEGRLSQGAINRIIDCQPYSGGTGADLVVLHKLNNIDKHRLIVAVVSRLRGVDLGAYMSTMLQKVVPYPIPDMSAFFAPEDVQPLEVGHEIFIDAEDAEPNKKMKFAVEIAIHEPGIIESKSLLETLQHLADLVRSIIMMFGPDLA